MPTPEDAQYIPLLVPIVEALAAELAKAALPPLLGKLKSTSRRSIVKRLAESVSNEAHVKTLLSYDTAIRVDSFFVPPTLVDPARPQLRMPPIDDPGNLCARGHGVLLTGTVGQGKSILLRHLAQTEATRGRLPLFIELRNSIGTKIEHIVAEKLSSAGLQGISEDQVIALLASGKVSVLLDGVDEIVDDSRRSGFPTEVDAFLDRNPNARLVVTSRPGVGTETSRRLKPYAIAELDAATRSTLIQKVGGEDSKQLEDALKSGAYGHLEELLTTPLMIALLVVHFRVRDELPRTYAGFFADLFDLLVSRHDKRKQGFRRPRRSGLQDHQLREVFITACMAIKQRYSVASNRASADIERSEIVRVFEDACDRSGVDSTPAASANTLDDIRTITCLILEEGGAYRFVHRSVLEYHAAAFVARQDDITAARFYQAMASGKYVSWIQELIFLRQIDAVRFAEHFAIPTITKEAELDDRHLPTTADLDWSIKQAHDCNLTMRLDAKQDSESKPAYQRAGLSHEGTLGYWMESHDSLRRQLPRRMPLELFDVRAQTIVKLGQEIPTRAVDTRLYQLSVRDLLLAPNSKDGALVLAAYARVRQGLCRELESAKLLIESARRQRDLLTW